LNCLASLIKLVFNVLDNLSNRDFEGDLDGVLDLDCDLDLDDAEFFLDFRFTVLLLGIYIMKI
jgi:hypothetical protein